MKNVTNYVPYVFLNFECEKYNLQEGWFSSFDIQKRISL